MSFNATLNTKPSHLIKSSQRLSSSFHQSIVMTHAWKKKDHNVEIIMHYNVTESRADIQDKLVRKYNCRSTRHWHLKLFLNLIDVGCVNEFELWLLIYPNWHQKKNHWSYLCQCSLREELVRSNIRRHDRRNFNIHSHRAMKVMGVPCKNQLLLQLQRKMDEDGWKWHGRCVFVQQPRAE